MSLVQELQPTDSVHQLNYCQWFLNYTQRMTKLDVTFFNYEAWFTLSKHVNTRNNWYWSQENPHQFLEASPSCGENWSLGCCLFSRNCRGYFYLRITGEVYRNIITQFISLLTLDNRYCSLQQDEAMAHMAQETMNMLHEFFNDQQLITVGL